MESKNSMSHRNEKDQALPVLEDNLPTLTLTYKECYLSMGRGALLVYAQDIISGVTPKNLDYRTKKEMVEIFDDQNSQKNLSEMITNYDPKNEGIMALITSKSNATYFITVKFN